MALTKQLEDYISAIQTDSIPEERIQILHLLIDYIKDKRKSNGSVNLNFICTHNSRRSHLSQIWAQTMAHHFGLDKVFCYSGGTEATAIFPMVIETLQDCGFLIDQLAEGNNPVYAIKYSENEMPIIGFSKKMDANFNPASEFCALMTCAQADEGCPFVPGAEKRIPLKYDDPKVFDHTPLQAQKYRERSLQIATEMKYVFSKFQQ